MSDLQELINKIKVGVETIQTFVYYDRDNGNIHKVSSTNVQDDNYGIISVTAEEAKPILTGEKRTDEFVVKYDISSKQIRMTEVAYEDTHKTASTMCYQVPVIKNFHSGHLALEHIYEGTDVFLWNIKYGYSKGQCVWYKNNVYKLATNIKKNKVFKASIHILFIENVTLTTVPTQSHSKEKMQLSPEYDGIFVDVWYKELSHLAGQHVWLNGNVYKILRDQENNTEFTMDNAALLVGSVQLYADENELLPTVKNLKDGCIILKNNSIYSVNFKPQQFTRDSASVFFYNTPTMLLYYNKYKCFQTNLADINSDIIDTDILLELLDSTNLPNGQIILSGKDLYQTQVNKEYDIIVQQDTINKCWTIKLNPYTKKFLLSSGYKPAETLYFSVTSKYDPNILYKSLKFSVADLLSDTTSVVPFTYDTEQSKNSVSIYTAKYFDSYAHEVI